MSSCWDPKSFLLAKIKPALDVLTLHLCMSEKFINLIKRTYNKKHHRFKVQAQNTISIHIISIENLFIPSITSCINTYIRYMSNSGTKLIDTCSAICLSAIKDGCMFPISFFGGSGRSILACWMLAWSAAKSLYLRETFHLFSLLGPLCTRIIYSCKTRSLHISLQTKGGVNLAH